MLIDIDQIEYVALNNDFFNYFSTDGKLSSCLDVFPPIMQRPSIYIYFLLIIYNIFTIQV